MTARSAMRFMGDLFPGFGRESRRGEGKEILCSDRRTLARGGVWRQERVFDESSVRRFQIECEEVG